MDPSSAKPTPHVRVIRLAYALLDGGELERLGEAYARTVEMVTPDERLRGIEEVARLFAEILTAFPDVSHELLEVVEENDAVAARWVVRGTHLGPLVTPDGVAPPTGRTFEVPIAEFVRIVDGRIASSISYWDDALFASQLGLGEVDDPHDDSPRDAYGRRPLTEEERWELLDRPLVGIWSTLSERGRIHSVPVHFGRRGTELVVLTERRSRKARNARRTGRATLCVEHTLGGRDRRYVAVEGPVREEAVTGQVLATLAERYGWAGDGALDIAAFEGSVILVLGPEGWVAWSDADPPE